MQEIFSEEFLREMNYKADLLRKLEVFRKSDNLKYSKLVDEHNLQHKRLYSLSVEKLKELVQELK